MAKTLVAFPVEDEAQSRARYPWDGENGWLNGEVWELSQGTKEQYKAGEADFYVTPKSFQSAVKQAVENRKGSVRIAARKNDEGEQIGMVIQFVPTIPAPAEASE